MCEGRLTDIVHFLKSYSLHVESGDGSSCRGKKMKIQYNSKFVDSRFEGAPEDTDVFTIKWETHIVCDGQRVEPNMVTGYDLMCVFGELEKKFLEEVVPQKISSRPGSHAFVGFVDIRHKAGTSRIDLVCRAGIA